MSDERLSALLERYLDGQLDDAERAELEETLRTSAAARAQFWADTRLHSLLHEVERSEAGASGGETGSAGKGGPRRWSRLALLLAAALLIFAAAAWWQGRSTFQKSEPSSFPALVGQLRSAADAQWAGETPASLLHAGHFELQRGVAEIVLAGEAVVVVQGPARFALDSAGRLTLSAGRLRAEAGPTPLELHTPAGNWIVQTASAGLAVRDGVVEMHVFAGTATPPDGPPLSASSAVRLARSSREKIAAEARAFPTASRTIDLPVGNAGFEKTEEIGGAGLPVVFGRWSGDHVTPVPEERGIRPMQGARFLRFLDADSDPVPHDPPLNSAEQWQLIDMKPWHDQLAGGGASAEVGAWFNRQPGANSPRAFLVGLFACRGTAAEAPAIWRNYAEETLAHAGNQIKADDDPATWERASALVTVPEDLDFLLIVVAAHRVWRPGDPREFEGHYADEVKVTLRIPPRPAR